MMFFSCFLTIDIFHSRNKLPVPKFHYEKKSFNIVKCNTDLTENELEINVIRGISYVVTNPRDVDTYVKLEFPYPQVSKTKLTSNGCRNATNFTFRCKFKKFFFRFFRKRHLKLKHN